MEIHIFFIFFLYPVTFLCDIGRICRFTDGWHIASEKQLNGAIDVGKELVANGDEDKKKLTDLAQLKTVYLFLASENDLQQASQGNANMMAVAEKLGTLSQVKDSKEYMEIVMTQKYYVTLMNDYSLSIITTSINDDQAQILDKAVKSISFKE